MSNVDEKMSKDGVFMLIENDLSEIVLIQEAKKDSWILNTSYTVKKYYDMDYDAACGRIEKSYSIPYAEYAAKTPTEPDL